MGRPIAFDRAVRLGRSIPSRPNPVQPAGANLDGLRRDSHDQSEAFAHTHSAAADRASSRVANALTIDLEDWPVAVLGPGQEITSRVVRNTKRCLQLLDWHGTKATFFVLSRVAEKFPDLIREVHARGHEIASHGHGHELLFNMSPSRFAEDVSRSIEILTAITGTRPIGYRAPAFSVISETRWAGPILADLGFKYDSSIFPIRHPRYGIPGSPRRIHRWENCDLIECPPATCRIFGTTLPIAGGGYFRLLPGPLVRAAVRGMNRSNMPAILYMHPYELDVGGVLAHRLDGVSVGNIRHFTQALFRSRIEKRLHRLLEGFHFRPLRDLL
ncbi:MAG: DUF3473 domain-containing protein [Phycisphaerae bacterium]|nr:DUF3473 domain-containing protein [Phycisphaerae bacterium]